MLLATLVKRPSTSEGAESLHLWLACRDLLETPQVVFQGPELNPALAVFFILYFHDKVISALKP